MRRSSSDNELDLFSISFVIHVLPKSCTNAARARLRAAFLLHPVERASLCAYVPTRRECSYVTISRSCILCASDKRILRLSCSPSICATTTTFSPICRNFPCSSPLPTQVLRILPSAIFPCLCLSLNQYFWMRTYFIAGVSLYILLLHGVSFHPVEQAT